MNEIWKVGKNFLDSLGVIKPIHYEHIDDQTKIGTRRIINDAHYDISKNGLQTPIISRMLYRKKKLTKYEEMVYQRALGISLHWCIHGDYPRKVLDRAVS